MRVFVRRLLLWLASGLLVAAAARHARRGP